MGANLEFLYDYIDREARKLESRLPKWAAAWISVEYCLLMVYIVGMGVFWGLVLLCVPNKTSDHVKLIDAMFNSISAMTGSGLATVSMSSLSNFQLFVLMLLCLIGAKVFTTLLELILRSALCSSSRRRRRSDQDKEDCIGEHIGAHVLDLREHVVSNSIGAESFRSQKIHPEEVSIPQHEDSDKTEEYADLVIGKTKLTLYRPYRSDGDVLTSIRLRHKKSKWENGLDALFQREAPESYKVKGNSWKMEEMTIREEKEREKEEVRNSVVYGYLARIVFTYWVGVQFTGGVLAAIYFAAKKSGRAHVKDSGGNVVFFTVFMTISHFANAGYAPINAGMTPFTKDLVLQIIFAGQMLLGNTLFPVALRAAVWLVGKWRKGEKKGEICDVLLRNPGRFCGSLYPKKQSIWLLMVTVGCVVLLVSLIVGLMWNNEMVNGFSWLEKLVNAVFQSISARHTGVNVWNLAEWTPTVLYAFILIMYVPGQPIYASQDHTNSNGENQDDKISFQSKKFLFQYSVFVAAAILLICIIENHNIVSDPLNYSVLNIILEVVSAFMNVGLSVGYSCSLRKAEGTCVDVPYSFSGKWSPASKFVLIVSMVVGRLR